MGGIRYESKDGVARVTIDYPERLNAVADEDWASLTAAFERADADQTVGVIVLTGAGDRAFCTGGYLADFTEFDAERSRKVYRNSARAFNAIRKARQPVIAAVNGFAIGGGNELVIACDLAIASDRAKLGQVGPKVGSVPVFGATNLHALNLGEKKAKEVVFLCRQYSAQEACDLGWINKVVPHDQLTAEVDQWCQELLDRIAEHVLKNPACIRMRQSP